MTGSIAMEEGAPDFATELATYEAQKERLLATSEGQYVVVRGDALIGPYASHKDAYIEGLRTFGNEPMLIRQILREEASPFLPFVGVVATDFGEICQSFSSI